uniref:Uncharacterized protein n=1 Tax=Rhipilia penicilloides TaxID=1979422 RepID=A0A2P0QHP1_9CHLO|nr:hypothetical protein [Rhipilia penicilloides]ARO74287.1 hypothetical protein [Rhipilia penicilloides]
MGKIRFILCILTRQVDYQNAHHLPIPCIENEEVVVGKTTATRELPSAAQSKIQHEVQNNHSLTRQLTSYRPRDRPFVAKFYTSRISVSEKADPRQTVLAILDHKRKKAFGDCGDNENLAEGMKFSHTFGNRSTWMDALHIDSVLEVLKEANIRVKVSRF